MLPQSSVVNTSFKAIICATQKKFKKEYVKSLKGELIGRVSPASNSIYCFLEYYCGQNFIKSSNFHVLTSPAYIAEKLGIDLTTAYRGLGELQRKKLIVKNDTKELMAVKSKITGKILKLGKSFSVLPIEGQEIFSKQQSDEEKNLSIESTECKKNEDECEKKEDECKKIFAFGKKESPETVTKPSVSEGIYNKDIKYNKYNNPKEDFEKIYEKFPKRNQEEYITSALLEKFEEVKTELGLEKLQEHVEAYAEERAKAIRKDTSESRYTSKFYTWLNERKWERYKEKSVQESEKRLNTTITEADIDALDECDKAKAIRKRIFREQGQDIYASWIKPLRITFSEKGSAIVFGPTSFLCIYVSQHYGQYFEDYDLDRDDREPEFRAFDESK